MYTETSSSDHAFSIPTSQNYQICGILNAPSAELPTVKAQSKLIIIPVLKESDLYIHSTQSQRKFYNQNGYDVLRLALSHSDHKARDFKDITLGHMAADIRRACDVLRADYGHIYIAAHGFAAFATALANADTDGQSLSEPCFTPYENFVESGYGYNRALDIYQSLSNPVDYLNPRLVESCKLFDLESCRSMIQSIDRPTQFVWAENGLGSNISALYKAHLYTHAQSLTIKGADHHFNNANSIERAAIQSLEWFTYCGYMYDLSALQAQSATGSAQYTAPQSSATYTVN
tara:strand:- start:162051 stop:162917 length:867 start_codon:yes stop_codon:yes gene_type:complete